MFDKISPTYDFVNRVFTFGLDQIWRKKCALSCHRLQHADFRLCNRNRRSDYCFHPKRPDIANVVGLSCSAWSKSERKKLEKKPYAHKIAFQVASALQIPYPDNHFDCVTITFGIRTSPMSWSV